MSKDVISVATLIVSVLALRLLFPGAVDTLEDFTRYCMLLAQNRVEPEAPLLLRGLTAYATTVGPLLVAGALAAIVATFFQTQLLVTAEKLKPKLEHINPIEGFKRMFSLHSLVEVLKNVIKITILLIFVYFSVRDLMDVVENYLYADLNGACIHLFQAIFSMLLRIIAAFVVIAAADYLYQWWDFERQMMMTKEEVKEEYKQTEGDPKVKGRIRNLQQRMARMRMMQQVPQADVVIRNPTHYAVALRYHPHEDEAPIVLAKGEDSLALRIVALAEQSGVTVIENVPLARALYAQTELNCPIPPDLFDLVADVMVYLYKLGKLKM